jgi:RNA polymerase sigma-70 factor, ECF subfamily
MSASTGLPHPTQSAHPPHQALGERRPDARGDTDAYLSALVGAVARGDQEAFAAFYDHTRRLVFGLALRVLGDRATAEEVTLDVYMQVWRQAGNFEAMRGRALTWLTMIARSRAIDRLRASGSARRVSEPLDAAFQIEAETETPEETSIFAERRRLVRSALGKLSPAERRLIETAYYEGLSHTEMAERFGLPLGTVKTRIRGGMIALKKHLATP